MLGGYRREVLTSATQLLILPPVTLIPVRAAHPGAVCIAAQDEGPKVHAAPVVPAARYYSFRFSLTRDRVLVVVTESL